MNTLALDKKGLLLMEDIKKWNNMTIADKQALELEKEKIVLKENTPRNSIKSAEEELERCFCSSFDREGIRNATINLNLKSTRDDILAHIPESRIEYDYLNKNYEKIFNRVKKIYVNDAKAQEQKQQLVIERQIAEQQRQEEEMKKSPIYKILLGLGITGLVIVFLLKWVLILGIGACVFIFMLICACAKRKIIIKEI